MSSAFTTTLILAAVSGGSDYIGDLVSLHHVRQSVDRIDEFILVEVIVTPSSAGGVDPGTALGILEQEEVLP